MFLRNTIVIVSMLCFNLANSQQSLLNDEFNSPCNLADWQNITDVEGWTTPGGDPAEHLEEHDISERYPGELYMMPWTSSWYANWRGVLLFKEVTGDFIITTEILVTNRDEQALPPSSNYSLAGLMIRTATGLSNPTNGGPSGIQDYIFAAMGRATSGSQFQLEIKNTNNSSSALEIHNIGSNNTVFMRMIRKDNSVFVLSSIDNATWIFRERYDRSDFPQTVQLGFVTYTDWSNVQSVGWQDQNNNILNNDYEIRAWDPDLIGRFDFARIEDVNLPSQYDGQNLFSTLTNSEVVVLFGHSSLPTYPSGSKIWNGSQDSDWSDAGNWNGGLPIAGDHIVIPNCSCPEVEMPILPISTPTFSGIHLEKGASLNIPVGVTLTIDLFGTSSVFVNEGIIDNFGTILVSNASSKIVKTVNILTNNPGSEFRVN